MAQLNPFPNLEAQGYQILSLLKTEENCRIYNVLKLNEAKKANDVLNKNGYINKGLKKYN